MATLRKELVPQDQGFNFTPKTFDEAMQYATLIANSAICPAALKGRPSDVLIILQTGFELGLKSMQALRTIGCINGTPFAYGDGLLALVKRHPEFVEIKEWLEGDTNLCTLTAYCTMTRKDGKPVTRSFSVEDAKRAGLWGRETYQKYPQRMLAHRARGFCQKDVFPDVLFGLPSEVEMQDMQADVVPMPKSSSKGMQGLKESLGITTQSAIIEGEVEYATTEPVTNSGATPKKLQALKELIDRLKASKGYITVTLKKFGVASLEALSDEMIDKWSDNLKLKEQKNDRS